MHWIKKYKILIYLFYFEGYCDGLINFEVNH